MKVKIDALVPHFMSAEPRPHTFPSSMAPLHGRRATRSRDHRREDVDVAVEHEMAPRTRALEGTDNVGKLGVGIDDSVRQFAASRKAVMCATASRVSPGGFGVFACTNFE